MENKKQVGASSSSLSLDYLFGPKDSSSSSSSSSSISGTFGCIFPPPSRVPGRDSPHSGILGSLRKQDVENQVGAGKYGTQENFPHSSKSQNSGISGKDKGSIYQNESVEPCCFSSSIYYGGQENYSPRTRPTESHHIFKKYEGDDDPNGSNSHSASRGNWWKGSLYY